MDVSSDHYGTVLQATSRVGNVEIVVPRLQHRMDVSSDHYGTVLQAASRVGNVEIVECLFRAGADVNILQGIHGTALRAAVIGGHEELVRRLIAHGADVNLCHEDGRASSVLHLALKSNNPEMFKALLVAGADIKNSHQQHILITVCKIGDATLVEHLLGSGVDINVSESTSSYRSSTSIDEVSPLNAACAEGHLSVVRLLLDYGADIEESNESSATPLMSAVRGNHLPVVRLLLTAGANVYHATHAKPLSEAAKESRLEIVKEPLSIAIENNALAEARGSRHGMILELLLEALSGALHEAQVLSETFSAAMNDGDDEMARLLLEHGLPPSFEMLRQACAAGALETVRMLVDNGIDIDEDDGNDALLLHVAATHSNPDIVQFLIDRGANVMLRSAKYGSPLIAALEGTMASVLRSRSQSESCQSLADQLPLPRSTSRSMWESRGELRYRKVLQCEQIVRSLFDAGAEMDTTIRSFGNALHLASYMGSEVIVRQLLERMENVNIFGGYFESPLIAGLKGNHARIVELLLNRDIDVNRASPEHGSALHVACVQGSKKFIQTLLEHGADINAYDDKLGSVLAVAASPGLHPWKSGKVGEKRTILELLLRHESKVQIRDSDLLAAASWMSEPYYDNGPYTSSFLNLLFEFGKTMEFTSKFKETLDEKLHGLDERRISHWPGDQMSEEDFRKLFYRLEKQPT